MEHCICESLGVRGGANITSSLSKDNDTTQREVSIPIVKQRGCETAAGPIQKKQRKSVGQARFSEPFRISCYSCYQCACKYNTAERSRNDCSSHARALADTVSYIITHRQRFFSVKYSIFAT